jgi:hypothetical protein
MTCRKIIFLYVYQLLSIPVQSLFIFTDKLQKKKKSIQTMLINYFVSIQFFLFKYIDT